MLGALFVLVTLYLPQGIAGLFRYLKRKPAADNNDDGGDQALPAAQGGV
jgi:urea transport system permease protein